MTCFPCFKQHEDEHGLDHVPVAQAIDAPGAREGNPLVKAFTFRELAFATKNFCQGCLLGEGAFGRIYKGTLQPNNQVVCVKQLDRNGMQGNKQFQCEIATLSLLRHKNLVQLIGYCADGDQRLLVYEFISQGSLDAHLLDISPDKPALDWKTRMKIAEGIAQGLEYLHEIAKPPVVYRDLKSSNVMLDDEFNAKLFDYGLAKIGQSECGKIMSPRVIGTYGYCAPEYERSGELTLKSDIYSFGVVLLELVTGRRAIDTTLPINDQNLVTWAQPYFKNPKRFPEMVDPNLQNRYPVTDLNQVVGVAAMCIQEEPMVRPLIGDILVALSCLKLVGENETPQAISTNTHISHDDQGNADDDEDGENEERTSSGDSSTDYSNDEEEEDDDEEEEEEEGAISRHREDESNRSSSKGSFSSSSNGSDAIEFEFLGGGSMRLSPSLRKANN